MTREKPNDMTLGASPDQLRLFTPEIFWHGREEGKRFVPGSIQGVDVSASGLIATAGNDSKVRLWRLGEAPPAEAAEAPAVVLYQELDVHEKAVNAVRFSPDGATLASAADDNLIILWRDTGTRQQASFGSSAPQGEGTWKQHCVLRGHIDDVYDLAWSPCGGRLLSGCVDGSCIVWGVSAAGAAGKGVRPMQQQLRDHEHYVQGVCWDPRGELVASVSCDRSARVYKAQPAAGKGAAPSFTCAASIQKTKRVGLDPDTTAAASQAAAAIERAAEPAAADLAPPKGEEPPAEVAAPAAAASTAPGPVAPPTPPAADADAAGPARPAEPAAAAGSDGPAARREGVASAAGGEKRPVAKESRLFLDESVPSFFRRPAWSPCGSFLLLPCGQHARASDGAQVPTCHVFARANLTAPCAHLPGAPKAVVAVRCCPTLFKLRSQPTDADVDAPAAAAPAPAAAPAAPAAAAETLAGDGGWMGLPYRVVWAVASLDSLIVYDSQQRTPLLVASGIHYAALTDLAWLPAGRGLIVSSADGFCSILLLAPGALGEPLPEEELPSCMRPPAAPVEVPAAEAAEGVAVDVAPAPVVEGMEVEATAVAAAAAAPAATGEAPAPGAASGATTGGTVALKPGEAHSDGLQVKKKPKRVVPIETSV